MLKVVLYLPFLMLIKSVFTEKSLTFPLCPVAYCVLELYSKNFTFVHYSCAKNKIALHILNMNSLKECSQSGA